MGAEGNKTVCCESQHWKNEYLPNILRNLWVFFAEDRPYNCEICKKGFVSKTQLVTHFRRYHHDLGAHQVDKLLNFMLVSKNLKAS